jgi:hypothetical protein
MLLMYYIIILTSLTVLSVVFVDTNHMSLIYKYYWLKLMKKFSKPQFIFVKILIVNKRLIKSKSKLAQFYLMLVKE